MAYTNEKKSKVDAVQDWPEASEATSYHVETQEYKAQPLYRKPIAQVILVSFVCFLCPGMFNALNGLGGGGQQDPTTADNGNVALYSTFSVFGFFGGSVCNKIGVRWTLFVGSLGYGVYMASLYSTTLDTTSQPRQNFVIAAGAILGVCAGLLWTAQGAVMLSYATERQKGRFIAIFWAIFNLGAVVGAAIPLGRNWNNVGGSISNSDYIAFMVLCFCGSFLPFLLSKPHNVIMPDGSRPDPPRLATWWTEIKGLFLVLAMDWKIIFLFPFFLASNWFYTWQFAGYNGSGYFSLRARTLNNSVVKKFVYWLSQIFGSAVAGFYLDSNFIRRRKRGLIGWLGLFAISMAVMGGNYAVQRRYTRESVAAADWNPIDIYDSQYPGLVWLYIFNDIVVYHILNVRRVKLTELNSVYWTIGALSNSLRKLAYLTGTYKGIQSAGAAIMFRLDAQKHSFMLELLATWGVVCGSIVIVLPLLLLRLTDHTVEERVDEAGDIKPVVEKA